MILIGLVHAVGGVNDKIEGFFEVCQRRRLTGKQGVIIPSAVLNQLSLSSKVIEAVQQENSSSLFGQLTIFLDY